MRSRSDAPARPAPLLLLPDQAASHLGSFAGFLSPPTSAETPAQAPQLGAAASPSGCEPWCGAATAEDSEPEPGLKQAVLEAEAMAIATSVSLPGRGGSRAQARAPQPAPRSCPFYFCLLIVSAHDPFLPQEAVSSSHFCLLSAFTPHRLLFLVLARPSPSPFSLFLEAAAGWRGGGKCSPSPICSFLGGNRWLLMTGRASEDQAAQRKWEAKGPKDAHLEGNGRKGQIQQRRVKRWGERI